MAIFERSRGACRMQAVPVAALGLLALAAGHPDARAGPASPCAPLTYEAVRYTVCRFDAASDDIRVFHGDASGQPFRSFARLDADLAVRGSALTFAMNAGMYQEDRSAVGLLIVDGQTKRALNRSSWLGNFYLKPNGVFFVGDGRAGVMETEAYDKVRLAPRFATQSGPMLVIDGKLHPRFLVDATSKNIRNGVGVSADEKTVVFAISDEPVTFHTFGSLFRDHLKTPNALYLDGSISRLYAPQVGRDDPGEDMGPIVGVVASPGKGQQQ